MNLTAFKPQWCSSELAWNIRNVKCNQSHSSLIFASFIANILPLTEANLINLFRQLPSDSPFNFVNAFTCNLFTNKIDSPINQPFSWDKFHASIHKASLSLSFSLSPRSHADVSTIMADSITSQIDEIREKLAILAAKIYNYLRWINSAIDYCFAWGFLSAEFTF